MGAMMGTGVGLTIGFIFGSGSILRCVQRARVLASLDEVSARRSGPGPKGALHTLSQYMLSSAATFGFFLSIGSVRPALPFERSPLTCMGHRSFATTRTLSSSRLTCRRCHGKLVPWFTLARRAQR
jgi:hypothetical protein